MMQKSPAARSRPNPRQTVWLVAVYIRLSREDGRCLDESESVSNQRAIIRDHLASLQDGETYKVAGEYIDDGISGTTDDGRENFQRMLQDIRIGRVNCVIVKDLARSFRNYSDQGYYLDDWFPRHNVRFISLSHQPLDSYRNPQDMRSIAVPIQGVLNENHCAETSEKVREVFDMKRRRGEHIGSFAVYGYLKNPACKNSLILDNEAAAVVQDIFSMFLDGMSRKAIVQSLNARGILSPSAYKQRRLGLKYRNPRSDPARPSLWSETTVTSVLKNRMYCGDMVQGRFRIKSYKIHRQETVPREDWYIVENTHEAIISRQNFQKAQRLLMRNARTAPGQKSPYLFSGFLRCAGCGGPMARIKSGGRVYYCCRTYKERSKKACTKHTIRHDRLESAVLWAIQQQIYLTVSYETVMEQVGRISSAPSKIENLSKAIREKEKELFQIARYKQALYQDWKDGEILRSEYRQMKEDYDRQSSTANEAVQRLRAMQDNLIPEENKEDPVLAAFRQSRNISRLTRDLIIELIDHIKIYEGDSAAIVFRFSDSFSLPALSQNPSPR